MMYSTLFLDLDNTLLDFYKAEAVAIREVLRDFDFPADDDTVALYSRINKSFWERYERGEIPNAAIFTGRFEVLFEALNRTGDAAVMNQKYRARLANQYQTMDGAEELLAALKQKGYRLYATTNGVAETQYKRIDQAGFAPFFDDVFISENAGCQKPEAEYFSYVISNISEKDKTKMLIIGDSQSSDILGGINSGIDTCWYNPDNIKATYPSKYTVSSLSEINDIL